MPTREQELYAKQRKLEEQLMLVNFELESEPEAFQLGMDVWSWLKRQPGRKLTYDAGIYSQYRWDSIRSEPYGREALFTITSEGPLGRTINYAEHPDDVRLVERFERMLAGHGIYYEMGFSWSFHFYPLP